MHMGIVTACEVRCCVLAGRGRPEPRKLCANWTWKVLSWCSRGCKIKRRSSNHKSGKLPKARHSFRFHLSSLSRNVLAAKFVKSDEMIPDGIIQPCVVRLTEIRLYFIGSHVISSITNFIRTTWIPTTNHLNHATSMNSYSFPSASCKSAKISLLSKPQEK